MNYYHSCKNGRQGTGRREDCRHCNPVAHKTNEIIVKQTARVAELEAVINSKMPCGHSERYAAHDALDRKYCVMCKAEKLQSENDFLNGVIAGQDVQS